VIRGPGTGVRTTDLQSIFSYSKERGRHSPYSRPHRFELIPEDTQVPVSFCTKRRLVHLDGFKGRMFSRPDPFPTQRSSEVCVQGHDIQNHGSAFWPLSSTPYFHKVCISDVDNIKTAGMRILAYLDTWLICARSGEMGNCIRGQY